MPIWRGLTDISCSDYLTPTQLLLLLAHAPNLVHFKATIDEWGFSWDDSDLVDDAVSVPPAPGYISLPFLRFFSITDRIPRHDSYDRMNAPRLTWVEYIRPDDNGTWENDIDQSIVSLLQRSLELKKLTVDLGGWGDVGRFWKAAPSITHLILGCEERSPSGSLVRDSSTTYTSRWPSMELQVDGQIDVLPLHDLIVARSGSTGNPPPLLPNLVSLEISAPNAIVREEDLISLIISRMNPPLSLSSSARTNSGIAQLKYVGVVFYRRKVQDIVAEIQKHAERDGADMPVIDLSLDYLLVDEYVTEAWPPSWAR